MNNENKGGQEVAIFQPARLPFHPAIEDRFKDLGVTKASWNVLVGAIYPAAKSVDSVVMALAYCTARKLDPFKKPVHIVPMWDSARGQMVETVWPGISEIRTTAFRTGQYAGCDEMEEGELVTRTFTGMVGKRGHEKEVSVELTFPEWGRMTVYRNVDGVRCKFVGPKVYWEETYARQGKSEVPNDMWQKRKDGQFEKCVEAAALRKAFPEEIGSDYSAEEMSGQVMTAPIESVPIPAQPGAPAIEGPPAPPPEEGRVDTPKPAETVASVEDAEYTETPAEGASKLSGRPIIESDEGASDQDEPFDPEAWLDEARGLFATCRTTSDVDQAHDTLEGLRADEELGMTEAQKYQDIHEAALARVKESPQQHRRRFFIDPDRRAYLATDDGTAPSGSDALMVEVREHEFLEFKGQVDQDGPGAPPPENDAAAADAAEATLSAHREWLLGKLKAPGMTPAGLSDLWEDTKPARARMIEAGKMTGRDRNTLKDEVRVIHEGLCAAEAARTTAKTPAPEEPPAPPPEESGSSPIGQEADQMTQRLRASLEAAEDVETCFRIGTETFPDRARLLEQGAPKVLDELWRRMIKQRRDALDGN